MLLLLGSPLIYTGCDGGASDGKAAVAESRGTADLVESPASQGDLERLLDKTFDDIKFDIEPDAPFDRSMLTEQINGLDGQRMRIRGYILPSAQKRLQEFVLVRDNQECCFGPGAALYDCILVEMNPGQSADYSVRPVAVEGRFRVEEFENPLNPEGPPLAIYRLAGETVR